MPNETLHCCEAAVETTLHSQGKSYNSTLIEVNTVQFVFFVHERGLKLTSRTLFTNLFVDIAINYLKKNQKFVVFARSDLLNVDS